MLSRIAVVAIIVAFGLACGTGGGLNGPTDPASGPAAGARILGSFASGASASSAGSAAATPQGLQVRVRESPSMATTVGGDGRFQLSGLPAGAFTLEFLRSGAVVGSFVLKNVLPGQTVTIVVSQTLGDEVVLVNDTRQGGSFAGGCPRGAGFWCQNQDGQNPNLSAREFQAFAQEAAQLLAKVPDLDTAGEVARAACDNGDQLLRQLATLALNLAADKLEPSTRLEDEPFATVGDLFDAAVQAALDPMLDRRQRNAIKDSLDRTNNGASTGGGLCADPEEEDPPQGGTPPSGTLTICHIPPGNPSARHTLSIGAPAWPAHRAHGDTLGPCS